MWLKESKKILPSESAKSRHFGAILRRILKFRKKWPIVLVMLLMKFLVVLFVNNYFNASVRIKWKKRKCSLQIPSIFEYSFNVFTNQWDLSRMLMFILTLHYKLQWCTGKVSVSVDDWENVTSGVSSVHWRECDRCVCFCTTRTNTTTEYTSNSARGSRRSLYKG